MAGCRAITFKFLLSYDGVKMINTQWPKNEATVTIFHQLANVTTWLLICMVQGQIDPERGENMQLENGKILIFINITFSYTITQLLEIKFIRIIIWIKLSCLNYNLFDLHTSPPL